MEFTFKRTPDRQVKLGVTAGFFHKPGNEIEKRLDLVDGNRLALGGHVQSTFAGLPSTSL